MTWQVTDQVIGAQPIAEVSTTQKHPLGTIVRAVDETYGEGEFIYLKGVANTVAGDVVTYNASFQSALATTAVDTPTPLAVAVGATIADRWGWYQISGQAYVAKSASLCLLAGAKIAAASGKAIAIATGNVIHGAIVAINASVVSPAEAFVYVMLQRPTGASDVS